MNKLAEMIPNRGVCNPIIGPDEFQSFAPMQVAFAPIRLFGRWHRLPVADLCGRCLLCRLVHLIKEVGYIDAEDLREIIETAGGYSISAFLVFLQLLK